MTSPQTTGNAVFNPDGSHYHTLPAPPAPVPVLPKQTAIGTGSQAQAWAAGILAALGVPASAANLNSLVGWFAMEDNHAKTWGQAASGIGQNNPLSITASSGSFAGVTGTEPSGAGPGHPGNLDFDTPADGISATAIVIRTYGSIYAALQSGAGLIGNSSVSSDLSRWSGNGYSSITWPVA